MIPELGNLCLVITLCLACAQAFFPLVGVHRHRPAWTAVAVPAAAGQFVFCGLAFALLAWSFLNNDFSVLYVASNSNTALPAFYKFAAIWGGHEGSLLLWAFVLALWTVGVAAGSRRMPVALSARILGVMGLISVGFLLFILLTSNPFLRLSPVPFDGNDLNPLLQDFAMAIHPPMLYVGYVGFSVAFAFAIAALLAGNVDRQWARWARPWTTGAWLFLTLGIALGSWWAYYELGWGGWWFWDPVENASFMPWLVGTALIHSLAVTEKRGLFKSVTLLLAIAAFSLSLLGTFLVRSGVLVSVHAFASDPARGLFILVFLSLVVGGALTLYAWRAPKLNREVGFDLFSRETFLLLNNLLLSVAAGLILLGTIYPLILDAINGSKISVGAPYFDTVFVLPMIPLVILVGVGMHTAWRSGNASRMSRLLRWPALVAIVAGIAVPFVIYGGSSVLVAIGVAAAVWLIGSALVEPIQRLRGRGPRLTPAMLGMQVAHLGVGLFVLGVTIVSAYSIETDQRLAVGDSVTVGDYEFRFDAIGQAQGPNYVAMRGEVDVSQAGRSVASLTPEKRVYRVQRSPMTEASIDAGWSRDLFVALGEDLGDGAWSVRIQYKPMIRFIWFGALIMALGGFIAMTDSRYRSARATQPEKAGADSPARS